MRKSSAYASALGHTNLSSIKDKIGTVGTSALVGDLTSTTFRQTYGHVQMYNGNIWISDFQQLSDFWPGGGYRTNQPSFVIYRWGD